MRSHSTIPSFYTSIRTSKDPTSENGLRFVNDKYLQDNKIYPLQALTVEFFRNITAFIAALGSLIMFGLWRFSKPKA
jgi:hypothetical protein